LLAEALRLSRPARAQVAEQLLNSLEESDDEVAAGRRSSSGHGQCEMKQSIDPAILPETNLTA
jgi:hypothetical protein